MNSEKLGRKQMCLLRTIMWEAHVSKKAHDLYVGNTLG